MGRKVSAKLEARAKILKAMAHPSRLLIIEELGKHECNVSELTALVGSDISTVSKHLAILRHEGIIEDNKRGTSVYYTLKCPCVLNFYTCVDGVLKTNLESQMNIIS
ncbi:ArsR/SmtB family transcription factor [candidate division KSB1 bacterium]